MAQLIDEATRQPDLKTTCVAETIPAAKEGCLSDFLDIMYKTGRMNERSFNRNELTYTFANRHKIQFKSFDSLGKAQSAGKRDKLFINEAPYIPFEIADALMIRTEGDIWIDYNPTNEFWAHTELIPQDNCDFIILNYKDNEELPKSILDVINQRIKQAETSDYWKNWVKVYVKGEVGTIQGVVFETFNIVPNIPEGAKLIGNGLDFGFSNDPSALIEVYRFNSELYLNEVIYETGLTNEDLFDKAKGLININDVCIADSAEPKSIETLRRKGWRIEPARKGPDSIKSGIDILLSIPINITAKSLNLIREFRSYKWDKDREGNSVNKPVDANNHGIDAVRYVALNKLGAKVASAPRTTMVNLGRGRNR